MRKSKEEGPVIQKVRVNQIGVLSLGKIMGIVYFFIGVLSALFFGLMSILAILSSPAEALVGLVISMLFLLFLPVFYGSLGFIFGIVTGFIYNQVAQYFGGLEMELQIKGSQ